MSTRDAGPMKVLLVEDEALSRRIARHCLESAGCTVLEAETAQRAEELWTTTALDAVVLDHWLPDGLGLDLLRRMRASGHEETVIWLSADMAVLENDDTESLHLFAVLNKSIVTAPLKYAIEAVRAKTRTPSAAA